MRFSAPRLRTVWPPLLALSVLPLLAPNAGWISILRGESQIAAELRQAEARGYYEAILSHAVDHPAVNRRTGAAPDEPHPNPPPGWKPFAESGIVKPVDGYLRWRMKPNLETVWNGVQFTTNSLGYRTPEVAVPKPPDVYRIVVLGSSNTMGHGVGDGLMYARLLEDWLNSGAAGVDRRVEVVNLAVSGDAPSQTLLRLQKDVPALEPDWILNDVTVLDYSLEELHLQSTVRAGRPIPFGYVRAVLESAGVSAADSNSEFSARLLTSAEALLGGAYKGWAAAARAIDAPLTLIQLPRTDARIDNPRLKRMADRLAERYDLPTIDLTEAYGDREISEFRLSPWDKHPSILGHRLIFEALRDALIRQGGGPGLLLQTDQVESSRIETEPRRAGAAPDAPRSIELDLSRTDAFEVRQRGAARRKLGLLDEHVGNVVLDGVFEAAFGADQRVPLVPKRGLVERTHQKRQQFLIDHEAVSHPIRSIGRSRRSRRP